VAYKIACSILAAVLVILFISPVVVKLKDVALSAVALIGLSLMITDIWYTLREKED
jgi:predicted membrane channel-forming protein YqfA (hemolysin III family)